MSVVLLKSWRSAGAGEAAAFLVCEAFASAVSDLVASGVTEDCAKLLITRAMQQLLDEMQSE